MITSCPKCGRSLQLPDGSEGRQGQCPACNEIFTISSQAAPLQAQLIQPPAGQPAPAAAPPAMAPISLPHINVGKIPLLKLIVCAGAFLMFLSFFLPWWGFTLNYRSFATERNNPNFENELNKLKNDGEKFKDLSVENESFYDNIFSADVQKNILNDVKKIDQNQSVNISESAFGWGFGRGIVTFIFGILVLLVTIPQLFLKFMARWGWTALLPSAALGLVVFVLSLTVWFGTPGRDFNGTYITFAQGVSIGPFLALAGSIFVTACATIEGIKCLLRWIRSLKQPAPAPTAPN